MKTATTKTTKTVKVLSRIEFKRDPRKVVYLVRPSHGGDPYETTLFDGKATACTCPAKKPCYHMTQLEAKEAARNAVSAAEVFLSKCADSADDPLVNAIRGGRLVEVRWSELTADERREANNNFFGMYA